ncbi:Oidioi.mRNA.OKI2018_I69.PAR.g10382.t1.cds [Oikopleura dioica]|uniref:Oidioi.mRNA.OKI2018_I69.PAR.g10382.t1.cds n=1 Tax=Oikopleura dioica TaxID=34765 RepID=A0ABN7RTT8_OIKDI|nr:Oidioi.mRNA.OKI2018_I69.PAR.g10382.t1.cds [Oikopleura dioica]
MKEDNFESIKVNDFELSFTTSRKKMASSSLKKKFKFCTSSFCAAGLAVTCTIVITILILMTKMNGPPALELAEAKISQLENELYHCQNVAEGSGEESYLLSDDEDVNLRAPALAKNERLMDSLVGKWKQVRTENMEEYMTLEGNTQMHINMAHKFNPNMEITKTSEGEYSQRIYVTSFGFQVYNEQWPWNLNGKMMQYKNFFEDTVNAVAYDDGKKVTSTNMGSTKGPQITTMELINGELHLTLILTEQNYVRTVKIFQRVDY